MRTILKGLILFFSMVGIFVMVLLDSRDSLSTTGHTLYFTIGDQTVTAWEKEDTYYLFLPSYAKLSDVSMANYSNRFTITATGETINHKDTLEKLPLNEAIFCSFDYDDSLFTLCIMKSENLESVFITTDSGSLDKILADKEYRENGKITVKKENGETDYNSGLSYIKGRGNYSWNSYEKKPFTISIKNEQSLLGLPAGTDYVLVSNASDPTLIRNDLVRGMEENLNILYTGKGRFVDLFINGEYQGNYYLCDKIEVGESRIPIANLEEQMDRIYSKTDYESYTDYETPDKKAKNLDVVPHDITGGYLLEREFKDRYELEYGENKSCFITDSEEHFIVTSPMYCSKEQIEYISGYFNEAEAAIFAEDGVNAITGESYTEYIDMESFAKKYLVEEVSKNYDAGISSSFFYKDSDSINKKIFAGPGWDYDMTFGNYLEWMEDFSSVPEGISKLSFHAHASSWYDTLYEKDEFYQIVRGYYARDVSPYLEEILTKDLAEYEQFLKASANMDYIRWQNQYHNNSYYESRQESFEILRDFIEKRKNFLDSAWISK